jgi:hypothetical protein
MLGFIIQVLALGPFSVWPSPIQCVRIKSSHKYRKQEKHLTSKLVQFMACSLLLNRDDTVQFGRLNIS